MDGTPSRSLGCPAETQERHRDQSLRIAAEAHILAAPGSPATPPSSSTNARPMYQGGASCELLRAAGKDPARTYGARLKGSVRRAYDAETRGYVWCIEGGAATRLALGDAASSTSIKGGLGLHFPFVALQLKLPVGRSPLALELSIVDLSGRKRRLLLSSSFGSVSSSTLHAQIPLSTDLLDQCRGKWATLTLDCVKLASLAWGADCFRALDGLSIAPQCKLRCIVALRDPSSRHKGLTLPRSVPTVSVQVPGALEAEAAPMSTASPLDIVGTGLGRPNVAFGSRAAPLKPVTARSPRQRSPASALPPPPSSNPTPVLPPRTPIAFFNEGVRRSGVAPPTQGTRGSREVGFVEPGCSRRSLKLKRPPTPMPREDEAPPSYDASVYAPSALASADFALPPPASAKSFDAAAFALPPATASFDAYERPPSAQGAAAPAFAAASFDDYERPPSVRASAPASAAASFDGYELPPSASFDAAAFALPRGDASPAVETIRLTPAHASPRSSVASDYDASASVLLASVAHRGAPTVNVRTTSYFLNERCAEAPAPAPATPAPAAPRAAETPSLRRSRADLTRASLKSIRENEAASPDPLDETLSLCDSLEPLPSPIEVSEASAPFAALGTATPLPEAPALRRSALGERTNVHESVASLRTPLHAAPLVCRSAESLGTAPPSTAGSIRPGSGASSGRPRTGAPPTLDESCVGFPFAAAAAAPAPAPAACSFERPPAASFEATPPPSVEAATPAATPAAASSVLRSAEFAPPASLRSTDFAPAAAASPTEPTTLERAAPPSARASSERAATPVDANAAALAEIAQLRAENARLRAAAERAQTPSPGAHASAEAAPPAVLASADGAPSVHLEASFDDLPPLVNASLASAARPPSARASAESAAPPSVHASMETSFDADDFAFDETPAASASFDAAEAELPPSARASVEPASAAFEAAQYELPPSTRASVEPAAAASFDAGNYELPPSTRASVEPASAAFEAAQYELPPSTRASVEPTAAASFDAADYELPPSVDYDATASVVGLAPPSAAKSPVDARAEESFSPAVRRLLSRAPPTASLVSDLFESVEGGPASPPLDKLRASAASVVTPPAGAPAAKAAGDAPAVTPPEDPASRLAEKLRRLEAMEASYAGEYGTLASIASMRLSRA